jgi:hypothetical protein
MEVKAPIPIIAMNAAAPDGAPPRRIMVPDKTGKPYLPPWFGEALRRGTFVNIQIFHGTA